MNAKCLAVVAVLAVTLVAATAFATADSAFADKKRYSEKSQADAQANYCGSNSVALPENVWCQNTASQIQGDESEVALASEQGTRSSEDSQAPE